jgi:hypothetical protein
MTMAISTVISTVVFDGQVHGLVGAAHPGAVYLARRSGGSPVRVVLHDSRTEGNKSFQDIVEVSIEVPPEAEVGGCRGRAKAAAWHRPRLRARDRDAGRDGELEDGPVDAYLLQFWPACVETRRHPARRQ